MTEADSEATEPFEVETRQVIGDLKIAFARIQEALPQTVRSTPSRVARHLEIDNKLSWKVAKLLEKSDPFEAGQYVPGAQATRVFLEAARRVRVPEELLAGADRAHRAFQALVAAHAGSRRSFELLLSGQTGEVMKQAEMEHRKTAFQANSHFLGVQACMRAKCYILHPAPDPEWYDAVILNGFIDLCRIRRRVPWRISRTYSVDDLGRVAEPDREPIDPGGVRGGLPLMRDYCTDPLPTFIPLARGDETTSYRLSDGPVGRTASTTIVTGEMLHRAEPRFRREGFQDSVIHIKLSTPCEKLVLDLLVHRELFGGNRPRPHLYSDIFTGDRMARPPECDRLELLEKVESLGSGLASLPVKEFPAYREAVVRAVEKPGWNPDDFLLYRVQMKYPPTPTVIFLHTELPPKP